VPLPAIAHERLPDNRQHYVVVCKVAARWVLVMDPAEGKRRRIPRAEFLERWTQVLILFAPTAEMQQVEQGVGTWRRFAALVRPHRAVLLQSLLGAMLYTLLGLSTAIYVQLTVDRVLGDGNRSLLNLLGISMLLITALAIYVGTAKRVLTLRMGQSIDGQLIHAYYRHILALPQRFLDTMRVGELLSRVSDAIRIRAFVSDALVEIVVNVLVVLFSAVFMFLYSPRLALLALSALPLYAATYYVYNQVNRTSLRRVMEASAHLETQLVESLGGASTLKRFSLESTALVRTEARLVELLRSVYTTGTSQITSIGAVDSIARLLVIAMLWVGSRFVLDGTMTVGQLMSCYALIGYLSGPMTSLIAMNRSAQDALIAADRLFEIMDLEQDPPPDQGIELNGAGGDIVFSKVQFRYGARASVLTGLDMRVRRGALTALVGPSGSGKSTIVALLHGLYETAAGEIRIGSHDLRHVSRRSLRRVIGVVPQQIDLFAGDVISNVALGDDAPDIRRVVELCTRLGLHEGVQRLPQGYRTSIGERGVGVSGGEKQRIGIARALYHEPEVLVLDEATSALDPLSDRCVQDALQWFVGRGRTVLIIAHRLYSIAHADHIIVIEEGRVSEEGTLATLLSRSGPFARMWQQQIPRAAALSEVQLSREFPPPRSGARQGEPSLTI
jgi:ATP-binding cassette, subfamily C, bacteriocin exporter